MSLSTNDNATPLLGFLPGELLRIHSHYFSLVHHFVQALVPSILIFYTKVCILLIIYIGFICLFLYFATASTLL